MKRILMLTVIGSALAASITAVTAQGTTRSYYGPATSNSTINSFAVPGSQEERDFGNQGG